MLPIDGILRRTQKIDRLNVLSLMCHERFEPNLARCKINVTSITGPGIRSWNPKVAPIPKNYEILRLEKVDPTTIIHSLRKEYDCIISQNRLGHYQILQPIAKHLHIPLICIEHTDAMPNWPEDYIKQLSKLSGDFNVFISDYNKERWLSEGTVIEHGIDSDVFCPKGKKQNYALSMCNDWINRDIPCGFSLWKQVIEGLPFKVLGDTPGLSKGTESLEECIEELQNAKIFLNTSQFSPIPMSVLEGMACGCAIVSSATGMLPEIIENGENGFITNDPIQMKNYLNKLLSDDDLAKKMGQKARDTILDRFKMSKFVFDWEKIFSQVRKFVFRG